MIILLILWFFKIYIRVADEALLAETSKSGLENLTHFSFFFLFFFFCFVDVSIVLNGHSF